MNKEKYVEKNDSICLLGDTEYGQGNIEKVLKDFSDIKYALDQSSIVAVTNERGKIIYANDLFCEISKYDRSELIGQDHRILNSNYHSKEFFKQLWATISSGKTWQGEIRNRAKDGSFYWVDTTIVPFLNGNNKPYRYIAIRNDITMRKQVEKDLKKSEEKYRLITENSSDLISTIDAKGNLLYVSHSHESMLGYDIPTWRSKRLNEWIHEDDRDRVDYEINALVNKKIASSHLEFRLRTSNGEYIYVDTTINPVIDPSDPLKKWVLVMRNVTERVKSEKRIYHLAYHDTLTDLPNRRLLMNHLWGRLANMDQSQQAAVLFIDIDQFKFVNDTYGHEIGDLILTEVGQRIKETLRSTDFIARIGGDEFTAISENIQSEDDVKSLVQRIQEKVQEPISVPGEQYSPTCSIGISLYPKDGKNVDELLKRADTALYAVKERGRNGFALFTHEMEEKSLERILMENELQNALKHDQFYLDYQPKLDFSKGKLIGMEALVRWCHPELGRIPPNKFIPLAEDTRLIIPLGEWVLRQACLQNKQWQDRGYDPVKISVNVSVHQLEDPQLVHKIKTILDETELDPKWLELEVTESVFANVDNAADILQAIRDLNVTISIDDFGTGYSSFSYIKHLPVDTLKIDSSFIRDIHQNMESQAIVKAILTLATTLKMNVIAEGIESKDQLTALNQGGCTNGQGFLFSKPVSSNDFEKYLQNSQLLLENGNNEL